MVETNNIIWSDLTLFILIGLFLYSKDKISNKVST